MIKQYLSKTLRWAADRSIRSKRISKLFFNSNTLFNTKIFCDFGDHRLIFDPNETIGRRLLLTGNFNRNATLEVINRAIGNKPGGVMVEIGANIGTQTIYAALSHDFDRIIAIEPDSDNVNLLRINIQLNALEDRVEIVHSALSDKPSTLQLKKNAHNSGASTVEEFYDELQSDDITIEQIEAQCGDELLSDLEVTPNDIRLIWIDVEGHEANVFQGMPELLQFKPTIYFEYSAHRLKPEQREIISRILFDTYARVYIHHNNGFKPLTREDFDQLPNTHAHVDLLLMDCELLQTDALG
ncbi:MAG: FkbM family methyltransferase [Phycisphaerales bacterium JB052]